MTGNDSGKKVRNESMGLDTLHIIVGIAVVVFAVISFLYPENHMILFPLIFFLAGVLALITGNHDLKRGKRDRRMRIAAILHICFGILLLIVTVMSAISIWWR